MFSLLPSTRPASRHSLAKRKPSIVTAPGVVGALPTLLGVAALVSKRRGAAGGRGVLPGVPEAAAAGGVARASSRTPNFAKDANTSWRVLPASSPGGVGAVDCARDVFCVQCEQPSLTVG